MPNPKIEWRSILLRLVSTCLDGNRRGFPCLHPMSNRSSIHNRMGPKPFFGHIFSNFYYSSYSGALKLHYVLSYFWRVTAYTFKQNLRLSDVSGYILFNIQLFQLQIIKLISIIHPSYILIFIIPKSAIITHHFEMQCSIQVYFNGNIRAN